MTFAPSGNCLSSHRNCSDFSPENEVTFKEVEVATKRREDGQEDGQEDEQEDEQEFNFPRPKLKYFFFLFFSFLE